MSVEAIALADFGSTFTKLTLVEAGSGRRLASAAAPTAAGGDVMEGYAAARRAALARAGGRCRIADSLAASSAGGGLRVAAVGLAGDYTAAAARQAALNAGARVELVLAGRLDEAGLARLAAAGPDIVLFSGGTDGGQERQVLANARALAASGLAAHVVVACNREVAGEAAARLAAGGLRPHRVANLLPQIDRLDIEPARAAIRALFIRHVIAGRGLSAGPAFGRLVAMATPEAVLLAVELLSRGPGGEGGLGDLLAVDVGGATTDVHSCVAPSPLPAGVLRKGLPPLALARTVQGDLGMRWGAPGALEADGGWLAARTGLPPASLAALCRRRRRRPDFVAGGGGELAFDRLLATSCLAHALRRHCGRLRTVFVPGQGARFIHSGLDLAAVPLAVGTGGMLARDAGGRRALARALERGERGALMPRSPALAIDRHYVLAAAGLLAGRDPQAAFRLLTSQLEMPPAAA